MVEKGEKATLVFAWMYTKTDMVQAPTANTAASHWCLHKEDAVRVKAFVMSV